MIDPFCLHHGKRWSEHPNGRCLYCCLCFRALTVEEFHELPDGTREDVCDECARLEGLSVAAAREEGGAR